MRNSPIFAEDVYKEFGLACNDMSTVSRLTLTFNDSSVDRRLPVDVNFAALIALNGHLISSC